MWTSDTRQDAVPATVTMTMSTGRKTVLPSSGEGTVDTNLSRAAQCIAGGQIQTAPLLSRALPLEKAEVAYELLQKKESTLGVELSYGGGA